jgi:selenocysteine-specific translation elongation factor
MSEIKELNVLVGILGENYEQCNLIGQALGSPGSKSDLMFYNRLDASLGHIFCAITPVGYPDKIKPFLQTMMMTSIHIIVVDLDVGVNAVIGEILVAMELFHKLYKTRCMLAISNITQKNEWKLEETKTKLKKIFESTEIGALDPFLLKTKEDYDELKKKILEIALDVEKSRTEEDKYMKMTIDHSFNVKGVGTVVLGVVVKGNLIAGQMYELVGYGTESKKVIVKSIQKHDRDFKIAYRGDRVGLALKGIKPEEIDRDNLLVTMNTFKEETKITADLFLSKFYKIPEGKLVPGTGKLYFAMAELKMTPMRIASGAEIAPGSAGQVVFEFEKALVHDGTGITGIVFEMDPFKNKLRILGYFKQKI